MNSPSGQFTNFTSDVNTRLLHVGPVNYASSNITAKRRSEFQRAFDSAVEVAIKRDVDSIVLTGQLFATQSPTKKSVTALRESLNELRDAGIPLLLAGSPRDYEFDLVDSLIEEGFVEMLSTSPVLIGDVAVYGISPIKEGNVVADITSLDPKPADAESAVLGVPMTVSPPVADADVTVSELLSTSPVSLEAILAGDRRHRESHIPTDVSGCQVYQAGPAEYLLRKWVTEQSPDYPCSIRIISPSSTEQVSIPHRPFVMYRVESPSTDEFPSLKNVIEAEGRTVLVQLTGPQGSKPLPKQKLREWLREQTEVNKVWDDRSEATIDQPLMIESPTSRPPVELSKRLLNESVVKPTEETVSASESGSSITESGVSECLSPVIDEEEEDDTPRPNEITELYVAFWSLRTVVEEVLTDASTTVSGDSDHPVSQYRALLNKFTWGSSLVEETIPGYGTLQKEVVPFSHREYREAFGNGDWITDFQCIDTVPLTEDSQKRLEEHDIVDDASQYVRPVTPESGKPLPEAPMTEAELQNVLDLLSEFRIIPESPWEVTGLDLDDQSRTATYPMVRLYDAYREEVAERKTGRSKADRAESASTLPEWLDSTPAAKSSPSNDEEVESFLMQHGRLTHLYREIIPPEDAAVTEPLSVFALSEYQPLGQTENPPKDSFRLYSFAKQGERTHMDHFVERLRDLTYRRILTGMTTFDLITVYPGHEAGSISEVLADLARETVKKTHIIYADLLERTRTVPRQKTACRDERWQIAESPSDHLTAVNRLDDRSVILLDDVCTSGASLSAGAHVLRAAGADQVVGVTLGSTHGPREDSVVELIDRAKTISDLGEPR